MCADLNHFILTLALCLWLSKGEHPFSFISFGASTRISFRTGLVFYFFHLPLTSSTVTNHISKKGIWSAQCKTDKQKTQKTDKYKKNAVMKEFPNWYKIIAHSDFLSIAKKILKKSKEKFIYPLIRQTIWDWDGKSRNLECNWIQLCNRSLFEILFFFYSDLKLFHKILLDPSADLHNVCSVTNLRRRDR